MNILPDNEFSDEFSDEDFSDEDFFDDDHSEIIYTDPLLYNVINRNSDTFEFEYFDPEDSDDPDDDSFYFDESCLEYIDQLEIPKVMLRIESVQIDINFMTDDDNAYAKLRNFLGSENCVREIYFHCRNTVSEKQHNIYRIIELIQVFKGPAVKVQSCEYERYSQTEIIDFANCIAASSNIQYFKLDSPFEIAQHVLENIQQCENIKYLDLHIKQKNSMNENDILHLSQKMIDVVAKLDLKYFGLFYNYLSNNIFELVKPMLKLAFSENYLLLYCRIGRALHPGYIETSYLDEIIKRNVDILKDLRSKKLKSIM